MIFDKNQFDAFSNRYRLVSVTSRSDAPTCAYSSGGNPLAAFHGDGEVEITMKRSGFDRLIYDLFRTENSTFDIRDIFSIEPLDVGKDGILVVKYPLGEYLLKELVEWANRLKEILEENGHKAIFIPKEMDVSILTVEQLAQMRDNLTELIKNLSYDNIIGF